MSERIGNLIYDTQGDVAILTCDNPPVNALSYKLRIGLVGGMKKALADPAIRAVVLRGNKRTFIAGADIKEFANGMMFKTPVPEIMDLYENSPKPIVCAINGTALGGGLETAMCCHYRIASSRSKVGLPESQIGLLPGAGGTQRLPRLCGGLVAAEIMMTGKHVKAGNARQIGIVDRTVECTKENEFDTLLAAAVAYAREVADLPVAPRVIRNMKCEPLDPFFVTQLKGMLKKTARGHKAPWAILRLIQAACSGISLKEGLDLERKEFGKLIASSEAASLQHVFFAQRQVGKIPGVDPKSALPIKKVGVIGCGTMGGGIAMCFIQVGIPVVVLEIKSQYLKKGMGVIQGQWKRKMKKGKLTKHMMKQYTKMLTGTTNYDDLADCDIVIEAAFESMAVKKAVFENLDRVCKPSAILASNTSTLDLDKIASFTRRPERVVGTHFFAPANVMKLLENIRGAKTAPEVLATVQAMGKKIKKVPVLVGNCWGFVGNRMIGPYSMEAIHCVEEGADPYALDKLLFDFGWAMGPLTVGDLSGNDIGYKIRDSQGIVDPKTRPKDFSYHFEIADRLYKELGRLGQKTQAGWYDYLGRKKVPSDEVKELIAAVQKDKGITPRAFSDEEIIERLMYSMVNEGLRIVEEGIVSRPSDVDVVYVFGYGFPPTKGGPLCWADRTGMRKIRDALKKYHARYPNMKNFEPCDLLNTLADKNMTLAKYWKKMQKSKM